MVEILIGRANSTLKEVVYKDIYDFAKKDNNKKNILIVPEQYTLEAEKEIIAYNNLKGIINIEVISFSRLISNILSKVGGRTLVKIDDIGKNMTIQKTLSTLIKDDIGLEFYKKVYNKYGFTKKVSEIIKELKENNIDYLKLVDIYEELRNSEISEEIIISKKLKDIINIYKNFNNNLEGKYLDNEDYINFSIDKIRECEDLEGANIWIDGFYHHSPQMIKFITELAYKANNLKISLITDLESIDEEIFSVPNAFYNKLIDSLSIYNIDYHINKIDVLEKKSNELLILEKNLFSFPYNSFEEKINDIKIYKAENYYNEVNWILEEILLLKESLGYEYKDFGIITNDIDAYKHILKNSCTEYEIPYFFDEKKLLVNNPIVLFITYGLKLINSNFEFENVFTFLKTGFFINIKYIERLENLALKLGLRGKKWGRSFYEYNDFDSLENEYPEVFILDKIREYFYNTFLKYKKRFKASRNCLENVEILLDLLNESKIYNKIDLWTEKMKASEEYENYTVNTQVWNKTIDLLNQVVEIFKDEKINLDEFIQILEVGFENIEVGIIPIEENKIIIGDLSRSKLSSVKVLFILGVNEGVIPKEKLDDGILLNDEKSLLEKYDINISKSEDYWILNENYNLYLAISKPKDKIYFTYTLSNNDGKAIRKSNIINDINNIFNNIVEYSFIDNFNSNCNFFRKIVSNKVSKKYLIKNLRDYIENKDINNLWWAVYEYYSEDEKEVESILSSLFFNNQIDNLGIETDKVEELYNDNRKLSVSRLEQYKACPFSHFIKYGLRPMERAEANVEANDLGNIFHEAIEKFGKEIESQNLEFKDITDFKKDEILDNIINTFRNEYKYGILNSTNRYNYLSKKIKNISNTVIETIISNSKKSHFKPMSHEFKFDTSKPKKNFEYPFEIKLKNGKNIFLKGSIDRVDYLKDDKDAYINIIDYKSGQSKFCMYRAYKGYSLQLLAYLEIARDIISNDNIEFEYLGGFYFRIKDPIIEIPSNIGVDKINDFKEEIKKEINKELKLDGVIIDNIEIIEKLDENFEIDSYIKNINLKKDKSFRKSDNIFTKEDLDLLIQHIKFEIKNIGEDIYSGKVVINPVKNKPNQSNCDFCQFKGICQFDIDFHGNEYNMELLNKMKKDEILEEIKKNIKKEESKDD